MPSYDNNIKYPNIVKISILFLTCNKYIQICLKVNYLRCTYRTYIFLEQCRYNFLLDLVEIESAPLTLLARIALQVAST